MSAEHIQQANSRLTMRPAEVIQTLGIPASTLRRWSRRFASFLSPEANGDARGHDRRGHRRYTQDDLVILTRCKALLNEGKTLNEVAQHLEANFASQSLTVAGEIDDEGEEDVIGALQPVPESIAEEVNLGQALAQTLSSLSDNQQLILSGQQSERALLGVVVQDNFNLKEENKRLRERMVETERKLFELKRESEKYRTDARERMRQMEAYLFQLQQQMDALTRPHPAMVVSDRPALSLQTPPALETYEPEPESGEIEAADPPRPQEQPPHKKHRLWAWLLGE
ncbi:MAG: hypothetical protein DSY55_04560 [Clostridia bacterium]|nr:MAG: hypothetical protein DSY55_04560 [Clostridia bacterium]